jgi:hypothetical protein
MESSAGCLGAGFAKASSNCWGARFANSGDVVAAGWLRMGIGYGVVEVEVVAVLVIAVRVSVAVEKMAAVKKATKSAAFFALRV